MTIELDNRTLNLLAEKVAKIVVKTLRGEGATDTRLIPCNKAADMLGISSDRLRHIKGKFTHVKRGSGRQARLFFDADKLIQEYQRIG